MLALIAMNATPRSWPSSAVAASSSHAPVRQAAPHDAMRAHERVAVIGEPVARIHAADVRAETGRPRRADRPRSGNRCCAPSRSASAGSSTHRGESITGQPLRQRPTSFAASRSTLTGARRRPRAAPTSVTQERAERRDVLLAACDRRGSCRSSRARRLRRRRRERRSRPATRARTRPPCDARFQLPFAPLVGVPSPRIFLVPLPSIAG